jgi:type IV pilus assembly protein PilC
MPVYFYKAMTTAGVLISGQLAADSVDKLHSDLASNGLILQSSRQKKQWDFSLFSRKSIDQQEFLLFNKEFIALLRAGLAIPSILKLLSHRPKQPSFQKVLLHILSDVSQGIALSKACAQYSDVFDKMYLSSLMIGEKTGELVPVLKRYQGFSQLQISLDKKVQQALAYPVFLMITMLIVLSMLFIFVLPRFALMYSNFGSELPMPTRVLITMVEYSYIYIPLTIVISLIIYSIYRKWVSLSNGKLLRDKMILTLPLFGKVIKLHIASQVARTLSMLMSSGLSLVDTITTTIESLNNQFYRIKLEQAKSKIQAGESFSVALNEIRLFPETSIMMIQAAEVSGELDSMLEEVALYHEETLAYSLDRLMSYIEPLIMLLMGIFIGGIIFVMYLPIFSVADIIK